MTARVDQISLFIAAPPERLFRAMLDPHELAVWLPPKGMSARIELFEPHVGGLCRITMRYEDADAAAGKTTRDTDMIQTRFIVIEADSKIVQEVEFTSDDPAFAGTMKMCWLLVRHQLGTEVTFRCEDVPPGISAEDHAAGLRASLENLASFTE